VQEQAEADRKHVGIRGSADCVFWRFNKVAEVRFFFGRITSRVLQLHSLASAALPVTDHIHYF
jgi:hypothetical protein